MLLHTPADEFFKPFSIPFHAEPLLHDLFFDFRRAAVDADHHETAPSQVKEIIRSTL
jgi:hypothetical protein